MKEKKDVKGNKEVMCRIEQVEVVVFDVTCRPRVDYK